MCVTRPPTCATQLEMGSNSLLRTCTLPCMSATTTPYDEDAMVEIEDPTRRMCGLSARSCASLTGTTSKNGNCLHCETYQRAVQKELSGLTPGAKVVDAAAVGLEGVEGESIGIQGSTAHRGPGIPPAASAPRFPTPASQPPTVEDSSLILTHSHPLNTSMAFFGLRKWSTPVSSRIFTAG